MPKPIKKHFYTEGPFTECGRKVHAGLQRTEDARGVTCIQCIRALGQRSRLETDAICRRLSEY